jgi:(p)ppGpp synthase/HD superfamily hydrolase
MSPERAQVLAEALHQGQREPGGAPLIDHVRRVAAAVPRDARVVAWLHELLEHTSISEQALLAEGLSREGLRALRLLTRHQNSRAETSPGCAARSPI